MIGMGFFDNNGFWYHIGIGNNKCAAGPVCFTACSTPPFIWGEMITPTKVAYELPFFCGSYSTIYPMDIVVDNTGMWDYFVNGVLQGQVMASGGGTVIGPGGNYDFIETVSTPPGQRGTQYVTTIYTNALMYATSALNSNNPNLGQINFYSPSSSYIYYYQSNWSYPYWTDQAQQSKTGAWSITYYWV
jgi:hypothetical protein